MFKLIFQIITIIVFLIFLTIGIAYWKGGEPFRWVGKCIVTAGETVSNVGDFVDEVIDDGKKVKKSYKELKEGIDKKKAK